MAVEDLDEARHVRALEVVGQADVHVEHGDGVLHAVPSSTLTGWRMDLMPTLLIGDCGSAEFWTSGQRWMAGSWCFGFMAKSSVGNLGPSSLLFKSRQNALNYSPDQACQPGGHRQMPAIRSRPRLGEQRAVVAVVDEAVGRPSSRRAMRRLPASPIAGDGAAPRDGGVFLEGDQQLRGSAASCRISRSSGLTEAHVGDRGRRRAASRPPSRRAEHAAGLCGRVAALNGAADSPLPIGSGISLGGLDAAAAAAADSAAALGPSWR